MAEAAAQLRPERIRVLDAWDETPSLRGLRVELGEDIGRRYRQPGQYLRLRATGATDEGLFVLASAPAAAGDSRADLLLRRGAPLVDAVIDDAAPGALLEAAGPLGAGFAVAEAEGRDVLLFAAGSGIAAIRPVVQHLVGVRARLGRVTLFDGQRYDDDFAYRGEHPGWEREGVEVVPCCSRPGPGWTGERGRVQDVATRRGLAGIAAGRTVAFLCGMKSMVQGVRALLAEAGLAGERIFLNY